MGGALVALFLGACLSGGNGAQDAEGSGDGQDSKADRQSTDSTNDSEQTDTDEETNDDARELASLQPAYSECVSDADCDDGFDCTEDVCYPNRLLLPDGSVEDGFACLHFEHDDECALGSFCLERLGCVESRACSDDEECEDDDGCTVDERCDESSRTCRYSLLDGDQDGEPPPICGGRDCDDDDSFSHPAQLEVCNYRDDNCNGEVDEGIDLASDPLNCGYCGRTCDSGECEAGECTACGLLGQSCCLDDICWSGACTDGQCEDRTCGKPAAIPSTPPCNEAAAVCAKDCANDYLCVLRECDLSDACVDCFAHAGDAICAEHAGCSQLANAMRCCAEDKCQDDLDSYGPTRCEECREIELNYGTCAFSTGCETLTAIAECFPPLPMDEGSTSDDPLPAPTADEDPAPPAAPTATSEPSPTPTSTGEMPTEEVPVPTAPVDPPPTTPIPTDSMPMDPQPVPREGYDLVPTDSLWVEPSTNAVGVMGSWYGFQDEYTTDCCEDTLSLNAGAVCISGTTAASELGNYDIWGGGMALNFNDNDPWDGSAYSGIEFNAAVESDVIVLVKLIMPGMPQDEEHFVELVPDMNTVLWTDVAQPDWATPIRFDPSELVSIEFVVPPGDGAPNPFSLCISKMRILE